MLWRSLRGRTLRVAITGAGITLTSLLVLVLTAAHRSLVESVRDYAGQPTIDLWVAPEGTDNLIRSSGLLPSWTDDSIMATPGVAAVGPLVRGFLTVSSATNSGRPLTLMGIGIKPNALGGPPTLRAGRNPTGAEETALDRAAAYRLNVGLDDTVLVNGTPNVVVGLTSGTNLLATQFAFFDLDAVRLSLGMPERYSFVAVQLEPGADRSIVIHRLASRLHHVEIMTRDSFVANNVREVAAGILPVMRLVGLLGITVAAVLVVLLIQGMVEELRGEIAVLLAVGASAGSLGILLPLRAGVLAVAGVAAGSAAARLLALILDRVAPTVALSFAWDDDLRILGIFVAAAVLAAAIPVARLRRLDPLEAFRP